jgi:DNA-binding CsgD family transcriptional regulator/tetratricopeptide (TPR) repeat protein
MWNVPRLGSEAPLVGRADEFSRLTAALDRARAGHPGAVLLGGDAGVGKTRLLTELASWAGAAGFTVLVGHCVDIGVAGLPYLPFAEALQQLADPTAAAGRTAAAGGTGAAGQGIGGASAGPPGNPPASSTALVAALRSWPALTRLLPQPGPAPADSPTGDFGQLQLFDAVSGLLAELSADRGVLLVIEDLHWADQSTRVLLAFLLTRMRGERLAIVASYRADDLHRRHPLRPLLGELARLPVVERVELRPFTAGEMADYLRALHGRPLPERAVRRILDRSEGNAFFAEELLAAGLDRDAETLPTGLADVLLARLEQLPPIVQTVARAASVAGRRVGYELLQHVVLLSDAETEEALREAVTRHVLVPEGRDTYVFRHALLQEAVYADLLPGERVRLHAAYAAALAAGTGAGGGTSPAAELAYHCLESHDLPGALVASVRAATEASTLHAPAEALRQLEQALQLWHAVPDAGRLVGADLVDLSLRAAAAASACGQLDRAVALAKAAVEQVDPAAQPLLAGHVQQRLAYHLLGADCADAALEAATTALQLVPAEPPTPERAWIAAISARAALMLEDYEEGRRFGDHAVAVARELGLAAAEADAVATLALLSEQEGNPDDAAARLTDARDRAAAGGDRAVEMRATYNLAANRFYQGDLVTAGKLIDDGIGRAARYGLVWSPYGFELRVLQVITHYLAGDWDGSLRAAEPADDAPDGLVTRLAAVSLYVEVGRGLPTATERLRQAADGWHYDPQVAALVGGCGADLRQWNGDWLGARAAVDEAIERVGKVWGKYQLGVIWLAALGLSADADRAADARLTGDTAAADAAVAAGSELAEHARVAARLGRPRAGKLGPEGYAWLARLEAEWSRLTGSTDPEPWRAAAAAFDFGYDYEVARSQWRLAETLLATDQRAEAAEAARAAYQTAVRLGATPLRTAVEALVRRGRLDAGLPTRISADVLLTPRERDVLALLADGRTNRQIGRELFISEKTASVHVSNILGKLGASGRAEAVSIAHRRGLLTVDRPASPAERA